jgi:hypothetical protein
MTVVVWQRRNRSPLFEVPLAIGRKHARAVGVDIDEAQLPPDGGPFSFGDRDHVSDLLTSAGWRDVEFDERVVPLYGGGPGTVEEAVDVSLVIGPLRLTLESATPEQRAAVRAGLIEELARFHDGTGVRLDAHVAVIRATTR